MTNKQNTGVAIDADAVRDQYNSMLLNLLTLPQVATKVMLCTTDDEGHVIRVAESFWEENSVLLKDDDTGELLDVFKMIAAVAEMHLLLQDISTEDRTC